MWLDNTPFKSNAVSMKRDTFFAIISAVMELKAPDLENLCGSGGKLNDKLALTLSKYLFKAFDLIGKRDQRKYKFFHILHKYLIPNDYFYFYRVDFTRPKRTTFDKSTTQNQREDGKLLHIESPIRKISNLGSKQVRIS